MNRGLMKLNAVGGSLLTRSRRLLGAGTFLALAGSTLSLGACVVRPARVSWDYSSNTAPGPDGDIYVRTAPPPPMSDYRTIAPGAGYQWVEGYWDWTGYDWSWVGGYWVPARDGYGWTRPRYVIVSGRWLYQPGYWQGNGGQRDYHYGRPVQNNNGWRAAPSNGSNPNAGNSGWRAAPSSGSNPNAGGGWRAAPSGGSNPNAGGGGWRASPNAAPSPSAPPASAGGSWRSSPEASSPQPMPAPNRAAPGGGWSSTPTPSSTPAPQAAPQRARPGWGSQPSAEPSPSMAGSRARQAPSYQPAPTPSRGPSSFVPGSSRSSPQPVESSGPTRSRGRAAPR